MASRWITVDLKDPEHDLPSCACCYVFYCDGTLTYVGSTENLTKRFHRHGINYHRYSAFIITPWGDYLDVVVKVCPSRKYGDWAMKELRLIRRLQPPGNRRGIRHQKAS